MTNLLQLQLTWDDPADGTRRSPILSTPIALGRDFAQMPAQLGEQRVSRMVLNSSQVSRFHALIEAIDGALVLTDQNSRSGTIVNGTRQQRITLANGDQLQLGNYHITVSFLAPIPPTSPPSSTSILFHPDTDLPDPTLPPAIPDPVAALHSSPDNFPPAVFQMQQVAIADLHSTRLPIQEVDYLAIGGGLGSFTWVDLLRISGVLSAQVLVLGMEPQPYARYQRLCTNSQIPLHERLRSNSDSCPDNIWGFPSYAWREAWHDARQGKLHRSITYLWQVFAEPAFAETYTPRSGNVFASLDREAERIGWQQMFTYGRVRAIRKTQDGRYVVAYSRSSTNRRDHALAIARYLHVATGYPAIQFLPDLQEYRQQTQDFHTVVNAYEAHEHVYSQLAKQGGTVVLRGRGIVASRIVQRLYELRQQQPQITIIHLMRSPKTQGNRFGNSQRRVKHHQEFQPFNWPKACWGGELRFLLERASPEQRRQLLSDWGGTTTADRQDWQRIIRQGLREGWYRIQFGEVEKVIANTLPSGQQQPVSLVRVPSEAQLVSIPADFIIDATGLDASVTVNPLLQDLVTHYELSLNYLGRLSVANDFELAELRHQRGRVYAAGAMTLGGPYAAVDSFLGLQYAALRSVTSLAAAHAPGCHPLTAWRSLSQWWKWVSGRSPC